MPKLLFISRVALICNFCFAIAYLLRFIPVVSQGIVLSTLVILGTVVTTVVNILLAGVYIVVALAGRRLFSQVPAWLVLTNLLFFLLQVILLIK